LPQPWKPTKEELAAAYGKKVPDVIAPNLKVLFCGINPSLYSAAVRHHFARPGNRFWPTLNAAGFTKRVLSPFEERDLLKDRLGITNLVDRATASANELSSDELMAAARRLEKKVRGYRSAFVAFVGITAYRTAFQRPRAALGLQAEKIGASPIWILPNPSGLNAHFQLSGFARLFAKLRRAVESGA
jgi:TDG/mug DNA glycosylase family protein